MPILLNLVFSSLLLLSLRPWTTGILSLIPSASVSTPDELLFWNLPPLVKGSLVPPGLPWLSGAQAMFCLPHTHSCCPLCTCVPARLDGWCSRIPHTFPTSRACPGAEASTYPGDAAPCEECL